MFLQQGTEDRACLISACRRLLPRMKGKVDLTYLEIPGGFHDLHHDLNKEKCAAGSIRFLKGQMAAQGAKQ